MLLRFRNVEGESSNEEQENLNENVKQEIAEGFLPDLAVSVNKAADGPSLPSHVPHSLIRKKRRKRLNSGIQYPPKISKNLMFSSMVNGSRVAQRSVLCIIFFDGLTYLLFSLHTFISEENFSFKSLLLHQDKSRLGIWKRRVFFLCTVEDVRTRKFYLQLLDLKMTTIQSKKFYNNFLGCLNKNCLLFIFTLQVEFNRWVTRQ